MKSIPNIISASRCAAAIVMLLFSSFSTYFWVMYCWCGFSDMIDGPLARKMNAVSDIGSRIDSLADLVFVICAGIKILPSITLPLWIWIWVLAIGLVKTIGIWIVSKRKGHFLIPHSALNKLTGGLLFFLPFAMLWLDTTIPAVVVCAVASAALFDMKG